MKLCRVFFPKPRVVSYKEFMTFVVAIYKVFQRLLKEKATTQQEGSFEQLFEDLFYEVKFL